jgi:hypothetical protein
MIWNWYELCSEVIVPGDFIGVTYTSLLPAKRGTARKCALWGLKTEGTADDLRKPAVRYVKKIPGRIPHRERNPR